MLLVVVGVRSQSCVGIFFIFSFREIRVNSIVTLKGGLSHAFRHCAFVQCHAIFFDAVLILDRP